MPQAAQAKGTALRGLMPQAAQTQGDGALKLERLSRVQIIAAVSCCRLPVIFRVRFFVVWHEALGRACEDHLSDRHSSVQAHGSVSDVDDFESDLGRRMTETGINKSCRYVHHYAESEPGWTCL